MPAPYAHTRLTHAELTKLLEYDPKSGIFMWLVPRSSRALAGDEAGSLRADGNVIITVKGRQYLAQRLAWLYMEGSLPEGRLTARDRDPSNLAWDNIILESEVYSRTRAATYQRRRRRQIRAWLDSADSDTVKAVVMDDLDHTRPPVPRRRKH